MGYYDMIDQERKAFKENCANDAQPLDEIQVSIPVADAEGFVAEWTREQLEARVNGATPVTDVYRCNSRVRLRVLDALDARPKPRVPVTADTPNGTLITRHLTGLDCDVTAWFVGGDPMAPDERFYFQFTDAEHITDDPGHYSDGWFVVDEPTPEPLPGTRVGDRMTEHTPIGATVEHPERGSGEIVHHQRYAAIFASGGFGSYIEGWTVVSLPVVDEGTER